MLKQKARAIALGVLAGDLALTALSLPVAYMIRHGVLTSISPTLFPSSKISRKRGIRRLCMNITPSMNCTRCFLQASIISRKSATLTAHGFSQTTCLPAAAARRTHSFRKPVGRGI